MRVWHCVDRERGAALALTLLVAAILLGLGLAIVFLTFMQRTTSTHIMREQQAFFTADVESAYLTIGRAVLTMYNRWDENLLSDAATSPNCTRDNPPTGVCVDQIPQTMQDLLGPQCKGRILRRPSSAAWDLTNPDANPFRVRCAQSDRFCDCRIVLPDGSELPQRVTLYVRNDIQDVSVLQETNGEITLIAVSETTTRPPARVVLAFDLSGQVEGELEYNIWQTGAVEQGPVESP